MNTIIISQKETTAPTAEDMELIYIKNGVLLSELDAAEAEIKRLNHRIDVYRSRQFDAYRKALLGMSNNHEDYRFIMRDAIHMLIGAVITLIVFLWAL